MPYASWSQGHRGHLICLIEELPLGTRDWPPLPPPSQTWDYIATDRLWGRQIREGGGTTATTALWLEHSPLSHPPHTGHNAGVDRQQGHLRRHHVIRASQASHRVTIPAGLSAGHRWVPVQTTCPVLLLWRRLHVTMEIHGLYGGLIVNCKVDCICHAHVMCGGLGGSLLYLVDWGLVHNSTRAVRQSWAVCAFPMQQVNTLPL